MPPRLQQCYYMIYITPHYIRLQHSGAACAYWSLRMQVASQVQCRATSMPSSAIGMCRMPHHVRPCQAHHAVQVKLVKHCHLRSCCQTTCSSLAPSKLPQEHRIMSSVIDTTPCTVEEIHLLLSKVTYKVSFRRKWEGDSSSPTPFLELVCPPLENMC